MKEDKANQIRCFLRGAHLFSYTGVVEVIVRESFSQRLNLIGVAMDMYDSDKILPLTTVTKLGLKTNKAALLCYVPIFGVNLIAPVVWLVSEPKNNYFLRFHSTQALVLAVSYGVLAFGLGVVCSILAFIPFLGHMVAGVLGLGGILVLIAFLVTNAFLMYAGYNNRLVKLPVLGDIADRLLVRIENR